MGRRFFEEAQRLFICRDGVWQHLLCLIHHSFEPMRKILIGLHFFCAGAPFQCSVVVAPKIKHVRIKPTNAEDFDGRSGN